jgi:membrane protein implicated in regulation of membrane protease activity
MDGAGRNGVKGTTLIDRVLKAKAEKPFTILRFISVAAIVFPFLMLLASWFKVAIITLLAMGLVFFGYRYYAQWRRCRVIRNARREREKNFMLDDSNFRSHV